MVRKLRVSGFDGCLGSPGKARRVFGVVERRMYVAALVLVAIFWDFGGGGGS